MEKLNAPEKARNYTLDLLRVIAGVLMASFHWIWRNGGDARTVINSYWGAYTYPNGLGDWEWFLGTYTMGFFVFVTGYFLIDHFKKQQQKGVFGKGNDFELVYRFTAKTYVGYAPLMLFATTFGYVIANSKAASTIVQWVDNFVWNIWQFLGISGFGMLQRVTADSANLTEYSSQKWYIAAFIVFCCVWYCSLVISEKATVFILCPVALAMANVWLDNPHWWSGAEATGIAMFLPCDVVRLWGPLTWGIWGWYLVNAVKKSKLSKTTENLLGAAFVVVLAYALITSWTGYLGGMLNQDFVWMTVAAIILIGKDPVTTGINKVLSKLPLRQYLADFSAGLYLTHLQLLDYSQDWIEQFGDRGTAGWVFLGVTALCSVGFVVIMRLVLKPLYGKLGNALKLNTPVGHCFDDAEAVAVGAAEK